MKIRFQTETLVMKLRLNLTYTLSIGALCFLSLNCFAQKQESANFQMDMDHMKYVGKEVYINNGGKGTVL